MSTDRIGDDLGHAYETSVREAHRDVSVFFHERQDSSLVAREFKAHNNHDRGAKAQQADQHAAAEPNRTLPSVRPHKSATAAPTAPLAQPPICDDCHAGSAVLPGNSNQRERLRPCNAARTYAFLCALRSLGRSSSTEPMRSAIASRCGGERVGVRCKRSRTMSDLDIFRSRDSASRAAASGSGKRTVRVFIHWM